MQSLTVISAASSRVLTKNLNSGATYDKVSRLTAAAEHSFASLQELKRLLKDLARQRSSCVIRGVLRAGAPEPLRRRLTHFEDVAQAWVMLDIDAVPLPKRLRVTPYTEAHAQHLRQFLPPPFAAASFVWQASASAGTGQGKVLKVHAWFLLDAPLTAAQLRVWFKTLEAQHIDTSHVDKSTLRAVQPHYTADPIGGPYIGKRLGISKGSQKRVTTPDDITAVEPEPASVQLAARPKGCADVSDALIESAMVKAIAKARECLAACTVAYQDSYTVGTLLGPAVALQTWNDKKLGHETWQANADRLAGKWGKRFSELDGTKHDSSLYSARVLEGIAWGVSQERTRLAERSAKALAETIERTKELRASLLEKMLKNAGNVKTLHEVAGKLGVYAEAVGPDVIEAQLVKCSGFSKAQVKEALADVKPIALDAWREGLLYNRDELLPTDENVLAVFQKFPGFKEAFRYNVRAQVLEVVEDNIFGLPAGVVREASVASMLVTWLGSVGMRKASVYKVKDLFKGYVDSFTKYDPFLVAFPEALYDPLRAQDELAQLGRSKLDRWLTKHLGAVGDKEYLRAVAAKTLIAAVARAVNPGCQVDTMLVLVGAQGIGKTSAIRALGSVIDGGYGELMDMKDKDHLLMMQSNLLVEVSELRALRNSLEESTKAFMTRTFDRIRAPYAHTAEEHKRRMVFIGTTNSDDFLSDHVNRRYWPVVCKAPGRISNKAALGLWREAALRYAVGEQWWLDAQEESLQASIADQHRVEDMNESILKRWLKGKEKVTLQQAVMACYPESKEFQKHTRAVSGALRVLGWESYKTKKDRFWVKSGA